MADGPQPAGFWRRYAAWSLDAAPVLALSCALTTASLRAMCGALAKAGQELVDILAAMVVRLFDPGSDLFAAVLVLQHDPPLRAGIHALAAALTHGLQPTLLVFVLLLLSLHIACEQSRWRGTPGKRLLGMKVTDAQGRAPTLPRSLLRNLAGGLSWLTLNFGHLLAALPPRHRALHDRIAHTRVVAMPSPLPRWARLWLWLQLALSLILLACATAWLQRALDAALVRALA